MKSTGVPYIVFAGGGTGGHLFPGLVVAKRLTEEVPGVRITFVGSGKAFEERWVGSGGFDSLALRCRPKPRRLWDVFGFVHENLAGYRQATRFLNEHRVLAVVGLGGYVSVPMAYAAARRDIPLILLEQNAVAGRATRWLASSASLICTAFEQTELGDEPRATVRMTGTPIQSGFFRRTVQQTEPVSARRLLVLGGSGGARSLNENVPQAFYRIRGPLAGWKILHQSGESDVDATRRLYRKLGLAATVVPFLTEMPRTLAATDLVVCRAGGGTLAELAVTGVPAVLIPYPEATDDHQRHNAARFATAGGCLVVDERDLSRPMPHRLADAVASLILNETRLAMMCESIGRLAHPDAAWDVATMIRQAAGIGPLRLVA